jgi:uncharacterized protein (DUF58 family)
MSDRSSAVELERDGQANKNENANADADMNADTAPVSGADSARDAVSDSAPEVTAADVADPVPDADAGEATVADLLDGVDTEAAAGPDGEGTPEPVGETRKTYRLEAAVAASVVIAALGMVTGNPTVLLASVVGVGWAAYARISRAPAVRIGVERELTPTRPAPGETARVRLRLTNEGDRTVPDVRVVDRTADEIAVVEGAPRGATALRPGETATVEYGVRARRGEHELGPATVVVRGASGAVERVAERGGRTTLSCGLPAESVPVSATASGRAGRVTTDAGGAGSEFHSTREYRPGDPMRRVDWNRLARTGQLTTVEFDEERAASVVLTIDARSDVNRSPGPDRPGAVELATYAAEQARRRLHAEGHRVGLAVVGNGDRLDWLAPDVGRDHRARLRSALAATGPGGVGPDAPVTRLSGRGGPSVRVSPSSARGEDGDGDDADGDDTDDEQAPLGALFDAGPAGPVRTDGGAPGDWQFGVDSDPSDGVSDGGPEGSAVDDADDADAEDDTDADDSRTRTRTPPGGAPAHMTTTDDTDHGDPGDRVDRDGDDPDTDARERDAPMRASTPGRSTTGGDTDDAAKETQSGETTVADAETTDDSASTAAESDADADADADTDADGTAAEPGAFRELRRRLPAASQVLLFTPALDDDPVTGASRLEAFGNPVTVVSPNVTRTDSPGGRVAGVERDRRLREFRRGGARVVDWAPDEPVELALARGVRRWSV